jgi:hypothetical protein
MKNQSNKQTTHKCCDYQVNKISIKEKLLPNIYYIELWNQTFNCENNLLLHGHNYLVFNVQNNKYAIQRFLTDSENEPIITNENSTLLIDSYIKEIINEANNTITYYYSEFVRELRLQYFNIGKEWNEYETKVLNLINLVKN